MADADLFLFLYDLLCWERDIVTGEQLEHLAKSPLCTTSQEPIPAWRQLQLQVRSPSPLNDPNRDSLTGSGISTEK